MMLRVIVTIVAVVGMSLCAGARAQTQTSSGTQDAVLALLSEVRALRHTIETVATAGASGRLTLGRLQLQEQRLNASIARLEKTRERLAAVEREAADLREEAAKLEADLKDPTVRLTASHGLVEREQLEDMLKFHRREVAASVAEIQRLTAEEAALVNEVAVEQSRWSDLNRRLEETEHSLARKRD